MTAPAGNGCRTVDLRSSHWVRQGMLDPNDTGRPSQGRAGSGGLFCRAAARVRTTRQHRRRGRLSQRVRQRRQTRFHHARPVDGRWRPIASAKRQRPADAGHVIIGCSRKVLHYNTFSSRAITKYNLFNRHSGGRPCDILSVAVGVANTKKRTRVASSTSRGHVRTVCWACRQPRPPRPR